MCLCVFGTVLCCIALCCVCLCVSGTVLHICHMCVEVKEGKKGHVYVSTLSRAELLGRELRVLKESWDGRRAETGQDAASMWVR